MPSSGTLTLRYRWYLAHGSNSSSADFFRVSIVHNGGTTVVFTQAGAASNRNGAWALATANLSAYAGQSVRILIEAADASAPASSRPASTTSTIVQSYEQRAMGRPRALRASHPSVQALLRRSRIQR